MNVAAFLTGATLYPLLELLWRGRTHHTMCIVGGSCAAAAAALSRRLRHKNKLIRCAAMTAAVTGIEFASGVVINLVLGLDVWDYSRRRGNILGQVCPAYCALWFVLVSAYDAALTRGYK